MLIPLKFKLDIGLNTLSVHGGGCGSHLAYQHGDLCLWTNAQTNNEPVPLLIYVTVTGVPVPYKHAEYLGTALSEVGSFVVHAYRVEGESI